jgi:dimethylglycine catabolism B
MVNDLVPPGLTYLANNIITKDNILGTNKAKGAEWAKGLNLPAEGETIFFAGCGYQYSSEMESMMSLLRKIDKSAVSTDWTIGVASFQKKLGIDVAGLYNKVISHGSKRNQPLHDVVKVLSKLGVNFAYLGEREPCCGGPLYFSGLHGDFSNHIQGTHKKLLAYGVKEIISIVPSCTYTLRNLLPKYSNGEEIQVRHFCEVVADQLPKIKLTYPRKVKVTYHDSCQLVRYLGLIKEPRLILQSIQGIEYVEPKWTTGQWATCCGGGGGFEVIFPELSMTLAKNRAKELAETGAEIIVTHCPGCIMQLEAGLRELKLDGIKVLDLSQLIAQAMGV